MYDLLLARNELKHHVLFRFNDGFKTILTLVWFCTTLSNSHKKNSLPFDADLIQIVIICVDCRKRKTTFRSDENIKLAYYVVKTYCTVRSKETKKNHVSYFKCYRFKEQFLKCKTHVSTTGRNSSHLLSTKIIVKGFFLRNT